MPRHFSLPRECTSACLTLLALYHVLSAFGLTAEVLTTEYVETKFTLRWQGASVGEGTLVRRKSEDVFDPGELAGIGKIVRYSFGQSPDYMRIDRKDGGIYFYLPEELQFSTEAGLAVTKVGTRIVNQVALKLEASGVTVVQVPIPTRISVDRSLAPPDASASIWHSQRLDQATIEVPAKVYSATQFGGAPRVVDAFGAMVDEQQARPGSSTQLAIDTHWSSLGIAATARAVIQNLQRRGFDVSVPEIVPRSMEVSEIGFVTPLGLPQWFIARSPELQRRDLMYAFATPTRPSNIERLVTFGSSYSTSYGKTDFSFPKLVATGLGVPLHDLSKRGGGPNGSFKRAVAEGFRFRRGDVLVWEYPVRQPATIEMEFPDLTPTMPHNAH